MAKFKVGERVRIRKDAACTPGLERWLGKEARVIGIDDQSPYRCIACNSSITYRLDIIAIAEACGCCLQRLLPDSDTYHPADISIDDLMRSVRGVEVVS